MKWVKSSNLGYPRIGEQREWKKALESYWAGDLTQESLMKQLKTIRLNNLKKQADKGIDWIPVGDFTLYDSMLDTAAMFGLVPRRFGYDGGPVSVNTYFEMARGSQDRVACEMTKWFNTNYHYIVPEWEGLKPQLTENRPLREYREAKAELGIEGKPVLIGPYTFLKLSKGYEQKDFSQYLEILVPLYKQVLAELEREGVEWVQMDEPILVTSFPKEEMKIVVEVYQELRQAAPSLKLMLQTYFDSIEYYPETVELPVQGIGLDFAAGKKNFDLIKSHGFPDDKVLGAGIVDGRNIWHSRLSEKAEILEWLTSFGSGVFVQPSCSLIHVPVTVTAETELDPLLKKALSFADEKLDEVEILTQHLREGREKTVDRLKESNKRLDDLDQSDLRHQPQVREAVKDVKPQDTVRTPFELRWEKQQKRWNLPLFPTTTIGSLPQTKEVRRARLKRRKKEWSEERYNKFVQEKIVEWIRLQEEVGLDVLVHGEFERSDMVEYFGERLEGFAFTRNGWVQSYGSRCTRPPILYGDVRFVEPMTVRESSYAQSLTDKPVKGMLTGPSTILNWSFVRDDIPRRDVAFQVALALREEVQHLESAGIEMIQVDEPALREGLPLKKEAWSDFLAWSVEAFRLATSSVKDTTQIHTHMCYCEFSEIIDSIRDLDADVISIETSRSHGELIEVFEKHTYDHGIGLGVYDIHSPRIPQVEEMEKIINQAIGVLDPSLFWINPDCGLKTRRREEVIPALKNMVKAAVGVRDRYRLSNQP
ncbi:5-methyltetrahydropteroyltriglutamate--homocysteine S-methyltransferase [Melghirimyces algeriensis]|uniref:5-methyltetrahydropteroyltriglutamate--homocysteine methyltransferase n=1 Tax=Melghirimyces algeriensis TaxID=910412 RepID=A0A521EJI3_9BACL|nr:5-methyltetrahydropteroyltriglutamate--homocysteine S-methyltransferase [Melghirimyces algeriensis]SMO84076.1 methionine synthase (B12-independent) [Melghirimyces algeriensis]